MWHSITDNGDLSLGSIIRPQYNENEVVDVTPKHGDLEKQAESKISRQCTHSPRPRGASAINFASVLNITQHVVSCNAACTGSP